MAIRRLADVMALQMALWLLNPNRDAHELNYDPGPIDGVYGPKTDAAFKKLCKISSVINEDTLQWFFERTFPTCCGPSKLYNANEHIVSYGGFSLIHSFEVGTPRDYYLRYAMPNWPGGKSGVTVGIGYDIGYETPEPWQQYMPKSLYKQLASAAGIIGDGAKKAADKLYSIRIGYAAALEVFCKTTLPRWKKLTYAVFDCAELPLDCQSALISLCYNRGNSLKGERRKEMLEIAQCLKRKEYGKIPTLFRAQKRLWEGKGLDGLIRRREYEARLFEEGL